jgi:LPXTG-motif cell wall-anchored protein
VALWCTSLLPTPAAAAEPLSPDPETAATYGATWLAAKAGASIPLKGFDGTSDDWGLTLDAGLALAASGVGGTAADAIWTAFVASREAALVTGSDNPGRLGRAVMLAVALGKDPRNVGPTPGNDLVARIEAARTLSGPDAGLYGSSDPTYDGVFRQSYAILGLKAAGVVPDNASAGWLLQQQCADGSWMPYRSNLAAPCAFDAALFVGPDSNSTSAAVQAVRSVDSRPELLSSALGWLDANQNADGGWGFYPGDATDPNSTALVVQALVAAGRLADPAFTDKGAAPQVALLGFQLTCAQPAADRGALTYPGSSNAANSFATAQGVPALAGVAFPLPARTPAAAVPAVPCDVPTTTSTTTSTVPVTSTTSTAPTSTTAATVAPTASVLGVQAVAAPAGALAATGSSSRVLLLVGAALLLAGIGLSFLSVRRR